MAICMDEPIFYFIIGISLIFIFVVTKKIKEAISSIDFEKNLSKDELIDEIKKIIQINTNSHVLSEGLPKRVYTSDTTQFYQLGYISDPSGIIFPLFGRRLYRQRSDRWEYYIIEGSENKVKIPIKTKNDIELSDGDTVFVNGKNFFVSLYPYQNVVYNPNYSV